MRPVFRLPAPDAPRAATWTERLRGYLFETWRGRTLGLASLLWLAHLTLGAFGLGLPCFLSAPAQIVVCGFGLWYGYRGAAFVLGGWLWRIRTKLILSYLFVAGVPLVLLVAFVATGVLVFGFLLASHLVAAQVASRAQEMELVARVALAELDLRDARVPGTLAARLEPLRARHPGLRYSLVRDGHTLAVSGEAPRTLPAWFQQESLAGLVETAPETYYLRAVVRSGNAFLLLDRPLDRSLLAAIEHETDLTIHDKRAQAGEGLSVSIEPQRAPAPRWNAQTPNSAAIVATTRWETGETGLWIAQVSLSLSSIGERFAPAVELAELFPVVMSIAGVAVLVLWGLALTLGLLLARSITRSVHDLHRGTERLRGGDLLHRIPVKSRDQLGELADSFNQMAEGIQDLLREQAEKDRLEEELRIARQIQRSLLPASTVSLPGLQVAALCVPATEVGGDYYDLLPLADERLAVVVADVSGKGTSAALYMAELKGLVLSLSRAYASPAALLMEANRILATNLDSRSFITMIYAVVDVRARCLRYARAGHNPMIHYSAATGRTRLLAAPGLGLGLDRGERFDEILREEELPLEAGDIFVLYTDGLSEALSSQSELYGEPRLMRVIEEGAGLESELLKERILESIRSFTSGEAQHDDMTLVVLKIQ